MAKIVILEENENFIKFTLGNKPEYECFLDREFFEINMKGTKCWYIKLDTASRLPYIARALIVTKPCGKKTNKTYYIHWDVAGKVCTRASRLVIDHINRNGVDNRASNLRITSQAENVLNSDRVKSSENFKAKYGVPFNYSLARVATRNIYQAYYKKTYIASSKDILKVVEKIKKHVAENLCH